MLTRHSCRSFDACLSLSGYILPLMAPRPDPDTHLPAQTMWSHWESTDRRQNDDEELLIDFQFFVFSWDPKVKALVELLALAFNLVILFIYLAFPPPCMHSNKQTGWVIKLRQVDGNNIKIRHASFLLSILPRLSFSVATHREFFTRSNVKEVFCFSYKDFPNLKKREREKERKMVSI